MDGLEVDIILLNSSMIRSMDTIRKRSLLVMIPLNVMESIRKWSCVANRMARIMRKGSSENVITGSSGVFMTFSSRWINPPNGSMSSPKFSLFREMAKALMVKSLRF